MRHSLRVPLAGIGLLICVTLAAAQTGKPAPKGQVRSGKPATAAPTPPRTGDAVAGKEKAASERCVECHGLGGQGAGHGSGPEGKFAKLTGQHAGYLLKQLNDFRSGARKHDVMQMMVRSVEPADLLDIAAYFSAEPHMQGDGQGEHPAGRALYTQGDAARAIAPCISCHGERGQGGAAAAGPLVPIVGGQEWRYLEQQLLDWRQGFRKNSADGVMSQVTRALTDKEITELANYLAAQRTSSP